MNRCRRCVVAAVVTLLVVTAGCTLPYPTESNAYWQLSMAGHDEYTDEQYHFSGEVRLGGYYTDVEISDVSVIFIDDSGGELSVVEVGTFNDSREAVEINETFRERPQYVTISVGTIDDPHEDQRDHSIIGLERQEDGTYNSYFDFDPYSGDHD